MGAEASFRGKSRLRPPPPIKLLYARTTLANHSNRDTMRHHVDKMRPGDQCDRGGLQGRCTHQRYIPEEGPRPSTRRGQAHLRNPTGHDAVRAARRAGRTREPRVLRPTRTTGPTFRHPNLLLPPTGIGPYRRFTTEAGQRSCRSLGPKWPDGQTEDDGSPSSAGRAGINSAATNKKGEPVSRETGSPEMFGDSQPSRTRPASRHP